MTAYEGKAKLLTPRSESEIEVRFKDDATAFNGQKFAQFAGKGAINSQVTELLFTLLESRGVKTQHLGRIDDVTLLARRVRIIPVEAIARFRVAGSLEKRTGLAYGTRCDPPIVEFYFKNDELGDPFINDDHIVLLNLANEETIGSMRALTRSIGIELAEHFARAELDLYDIKFEFGVDPSGELLLADEISPDTCRLRDSNDGTILDKDRFRRDLGPLLEGYEEVLTRLRRLEE